MLRPTSNLRFVPLTRVRGFALENSDFEIF